MSVNDDAEQVRETTYTQQLKAYENQQEEIAQIKSFIDKFRQIGATEMVGCCAERRRRAVSEPMVKPTVRK